jgi:hypothetical protein
MGSGTGSDRNTRTLEGIQMKMKMKVIGVLAAAATTMGIVASAPASADPVNEPHAGGVQTRTHGGKP